MTTPSPSAAFPDPAHVLRQATAAIEELNAAASRLRAAREALDYKITEHINAQQRQVEEMLAYQDARLPRTLADHQRRFAERIAALDASFDDQLEELTGVHTRAVAAAHLACERAVENTRAAGRLATQSAHESIAALEEEIAARTESVLSRLRSHAAHAAAEAAVNLAQTREADETLRARLEQAAQVAELLDRRLAEILGQSEQGAPAQQAQPPQRRAA
jgi:hypothetical protein